jgi:hypothetical protein
MFFGPEIDMQVMIILLGLAFVISVISAIFVKEKSRALIIFSILANLILLVFILTGSRIFYLYNIIWFRTFSFFVWPIVNIYLINKIFTKK